MKESQQREEDFFQGGHLRIRGDAYQAPNGKWGWKMNIFVKGAVDNIKMHNGDDAWFNTHAEAKIDLLKHGKGVKKMMEEADLSNPPDVTSKKEEVKNKKRRLYHEQLIKDAYTKTFWERVKRYARYDLKYAKLQEHLLENKPEPNIVLISGLDGDLVSFEPSEAPELLDLPFQTCILEATDKTLFNLDSPNLRAGSDDVQALLITRMENGNYGFLAYMTDRNYSWATDPTTEAYKLYMTATKVMCNFINSKDVKMGQSKTNIRFKHKKTGLVKIKKLVHISRIEKGKPCVGGSFQVDWSHRWEVRGHWRSIARGKVGKDQNQNYNVNGFTWVKSHSKGPEEKDMVKKIRVVTK